MTFHSAYAPIEHLISGGRFAEARKELLLGRRQLHGLTPGAFETLTSELDIELGDTDSAVLHAKSVAASDSFAAELRARAHRVLGRSCFYLGDVAQSRRELETAKTLARDAKDDVQL